jgi:hypothetical protein
MANKKLATPELARWEALKKARASVPTSSRLKPREVREFGRDAGVEHPGSYAIAIEPPVGADLTALQKADTVRMFTMRVVPGRAFPAPGGKLMEAHLGSITEGRLAFGMPTIAFDDPLRTWNHRLRPDLMDGDQPIHENGDVLRADKVEEFRIFNQLVASIDELAFTGVLPNGKRVNPLWAQHCPEHLSGKTTKAVDPSTWMIEPYLGIADKAFETLFDVATRKSSGGPRFSCPTKGCGGQHHTTLTTEYLNCETAKRRWLRNGDFVATCAACNREHTFRLKWALPTKVKRDFDTGFMAGFVDWVADGGPLKAPVNGSYVNSYPNGGELTIHVFADEHGNECRVLLHNDIVPEIMPGDDVAMGDLFAYALSYRSDWEKLGTMDWNRGKLDRKFQAVKGLFKPGMLGLAQRQFFEGQARYVCEGDKLQRVFPARLFGHAAGKVETIDLWWDLSSAIPHFDHEVGAIVCPPITQKRWHQLTTNLPGWKFGNVKLDVRVNDPRFKMPWDQPKAKSKSKGKRRRTRSPKQEVAVVG